MRRRPADGAPVRQRITIAHELGHAVLHGREGSEPVDVLIDALEPKVQVGLDNEIDRTARRRRPPRPP